MTAGLRRWLLLGLAGLVAGGGYFFWQRQTPADLPAGIASGNGRIEAVEIDVSTRAAGRIHDILVDEGDFVTAGQALARMDTDQLAAQRRRAEAERRRAVISVDAAKSLVAQRQAEKTAADAVVAQRLVQNDAADRRLARSEQLAESRTVSLQALDDDRASAEGAKAATAAARAQLAAAEAAISTAEAQVIDAEAAVDAARAAIESITADIDDATLTSPRDGRVQFRIAQPGEVLAAGGRLLNLVDLSDVYMSFFLSTSEAGRLAIRTEARLVLDAAPQYVVPASISFVADVAQFTPKTVETTEEREKLMFRVKAKIPQALLRKYIRQVKTGLPGVAYVKLDPEADWPASLSETLVQ
jgi:HlyD family secretion protein